MDVQKHVGMCARHHAKWKKMMDFARTEKERSMCEERANFWLQKQEALVSAWSLDQEE